MLAHTCLYSFAEHLKTENSLIPFMGMAIILTKRKIGTCVHICSCDIKETFNRTFKDRVFFLSFRYCSKAGWLGCTTKAKSCELFIHVAKGRHN